MSFHSSGRDCNAKRLERELGTWRTSDFDNSGTGISRSCLDEIQDRSWTRSFVDGLDGTTLCMGCEQLSSEGNQENALSFYPEQGLEKLCYLEKAKPLRGWSQIEHEVGARSFCWQA